ncbi:MAG: hypothetical protein RLZZ162_1241 [Verrucomicrobiota bacterium]|jgi:hypothetical protein
MIHASALEKRATVASAPVAASASEWSALRDSLLPVAASASEWSALRVSSSFWKGASPTAARPPSS